MAGTLRLGGGSELDRKSARVGVFGFWLGGAAGAWYGYRRARGVTRALAWGFSTGVASWVVM